VVRAEGAFIGESAATQAVSPATHERIYAAGESRAPDGAVGSADRHPAADLSRGLVLAQTLIKLPAEQVVAGTGQILRYLTSAASSGRRAGFTAHMYPANPVVAELRTDSGHAMAESDAAAGGLERKLATILSADVAAYNRLMAEDEERTLQTFRALQPCSACFTPG
jgi:hypothetical protein